MLNSVPTEETIASNQRSAAQAFELDVATFLANIRRSGGLVALFALLVVLALTVYYLTSPLTFTATSVVRYDSTQEEGGGTLQLPGGAAALFGSQGGKSEVHAIFHRMRLPSFISEVVNSDALAQRILANKFDSDTGLWDDPFDVSPPARADGIGALQDSRAITYRIDPDSELIALTTRAGSPDAAKEVNDRLVRTANAVFRREKQEEAVRLIAAYERQLASTQLVGVQDSLRRLLERNIEQRFLLATRRDYPLRVLQPAPLPTGPDRPNIIFLVLVGVAMIIAFAMLCGLFRRPARP